MDFSSRSKTIIRHPMLQIVVGFFLSGYAILQRTGIALVDYFWLAMFIVGVAILGNGARKLRRFQKKPGQREQ